MEKTHLYGRDNLSFTEILKQKGILKPKVVEKEPLKPTPTVTLAKPVTANTPVILSPNVDGGLKVVAPSPVNVIAEQTVNAKSSDPITQRMINEGLLIASAIPTDTKVTKTMAAEITKNQTLLANEAKETLQAGGLKLPNIWIMVAMVVGVIVMYFLAKRKKG